MSTTLQHATDRLMTVTIRFDAKGHGDIIILAKWTKAGEAMPPSVQAQIIETLMEQLVTLLPA